MASPRSKIPDPLRRAVLAAGMCAYCGDIRGPFEVEHIRPLSRGGGNQRGNLACACVACNAQKRAMLLHEWISWRVTSGMPWPPIATHATEPEHYRDCCSGCRDLEFPRNVEAWVPHDLRPDPVSGYVGVYHCDQGHGWKCWWALSTWFYSDCPCGFCTARRLESDGLAIR